MEWVKSILILALYIVNDNRSLCISHSVIGYVTDTIIFLFGWYTVITFEILLSIGGESPGLASRRR